MKVTSHSARIEGAAPNKEQAVFMDTVDCIHGYGVGVCIYPEWFYTVIAKKDGRTAVISTPTDRWVQDLRDDGWTILQELKG